MSRICPFNGCEATIPSHLFACRPHWSSLTGDEKAEIYAAYDQWKRGEISAIELRDRQNSILAQAQGAKPRKGKP